LSAITSQSDYQPISGSTQLLPRTTILALLFEEIHERPLQETTAEAQGIFRAPAEARRGGEAQDFSCEEVAASEAGGAAMMANNWSKWTS